MTSLLDRYQDLPDHLRLALADVAGGQVVPVPLFPLGEWKSAKYPSLPLTHELADELIANFEAGVLGTSPVLDSSGNHDTAAPAAGWFKRLHVESLKDGGEMLFGDAELTDLGASMLNAGLYKYDSVELGPVVDNATGAKTDNVFRSATLTNTPVLRMLPPILDAVDSIAMAEPVEIALSEITLATVTKTEGGASFSAAAYAYVPDPQSPSTWKLRLWATPGGGPDAGIIGAAVAALGKGFRGQKAQIPAADLAAVKAKVRAAWTKANPDRPASEMPAVIRASEDDGSHAEPIDGSSEPASHPAKGDEGHPVTLADGDAAKKGSDHMKTVALKLNLSEDATEAVILAEVVKLAEHDAAETARADTAELKLAESAKAHAIEGFTTKLDEKIAGAFIAPGEREVYLKLAESDAATAEAMVEARQAKVIQLGEAGSGQGGDADGEKTADVVLAEKAKTRAVKDGITIGEAQKLTLAEDPDLAARIYNERYGKEA